VCPLSPSSLCLTIPIAVVVKYFIKTTISHVVMYSIDFCCEVNGYVGCCTYTFNKVCGFVEIVEIDMPPNPLHW
jgi:hypothetical protein